MTPEEIALLLLAKERIEQRREFRIHESLRGNKRPNVPLHVWREGQLAASSGKDLQRINLAAAFAKTATRDERLTAARAAVEAMPRVLEQYAAEPRRFRKRAQRSIAEVGRQLKEALESGIVGHRAARGNSAAYVQQEDLDDLVPDKWGRMFPLEVKRLAKRIEQPPLAVPLLCLLIWTSRCKPPDARDIRECGAGLQVSLEWLAKKLGCSVSWVKELLNRLDPHAAWRRELALVRYENAKRERAGKRPRREPERPPGTPYVHRYRRLQRYSTTLQRDGRSAGFWIDKSGRPHSWVDVRGVCYVTAAGRALLVRRATSEPVRRDPNTGRALEPIKLRPNGALTDLEQRLRKARINLGIRLREGAAHVADAVSESLRKSTAPPRRRASSG